jgi:hypothetical protein
MVGSAVCIAINYPSKILLGDQDWLAKVMERKTFHTTAKAVEARLHTISYAWASSRRTPRTSC